MANRYSDIKRLRTSEGREYIQNPVYPDIPATEDDIYIISTGGDRYDILAKQFYGDSSLWWIIASANVSERASLVVKPGVQIRIPADRDKVLQLYNKVNKVR